MTAGIAPGAKAAGVILGAAVGDALGWPQEDRSQIIGLSARDVDPQPLFRDWERNGGTRYGRYLDPVRAGEYSDDTQLLLAVARACLGGADWFEWLTHVELPIWPVYERGGGGAVLRAARAWAQGHSPWIASTQRQIGTAEKYFGAGANGVAMRIAPHVLVTIDAPSEELLQRVVLDGLATHGHPRALVGACVHALALRHGIKHQGTLEYGDWFDVLTREPIWRDSSILANVIDPEWHHSYVQLNDHGVHTASISRAWDRTCKEVDTLVEIARQGLSRGAAVNDQKVLEELGCFDRRQRGSGTVTAVAALYIAARTAARPMGGLMRTAFLSNADTDTLCSMTGSLLGGLHGPVWMIDLASQVADRNYLIDIADQLGHMTSNGTGRTRPSPIATNESSLRRWTKELFAGECDMAPDGRQIKILEIAELPSRGQSRAERVVAETVDGQTLIVDRTVRDGTEAAGSLTHTPPVISRRTPAPPPRAELLTVELAVNDVEQTVQFLEGAVGLKVHRIGGKASIGETLRLVSRPPDQDSRAVSAVVTVRSSDLEQVKAHAAAFPGFEARWASADRQVLWVKEPAGNIIRVVHSDHDNR
ncbi:ADP-ribosylglycohydrolase family protein [Mycobacteroides abscessus]